MFALLWIRFPLPPRTAESTQTSAVYALGRRCANRVGFRRVGMPKGEVVLAPYALADRFRDLFSHNPVSLGA